MYCNCDFLLKKKKLNTNIKYVESGSNTLLVLKKKQLKECTAFLKPVYHV